ncbi:MAG: glutathione peroxidase, partial [Sphingobacteriales bacterium]
MKKILLLLSAILYCFTNCTAQKSSDKATIPQSIYDFKVEGLSGEQIDFAQFKGKKILIVNTAS